MLIDQWKNFIDQWKKYSEELFKLKIDQWKYADENRSMENVQMKIDQWNMFRRKYANGKYWDENGKTISGKYSDKFWNLHSDQLSAELYFTKESH